MNQEEPPKVVGKTTSGEDIFFTPGKNFTQAYHNQEKVRVDKKTDT